MVTGLACRLQVVIVLRVVIVVKNQHKSHSRLCVGKQVLASFVMFCDLNEAALLVRRQLLGARYHHGG